MRAYIHACMSVCVCVCVYDNITLSKYSSKRSVSYQYKTGFRDNERQYFVNVLFSGTNSAFFFFYYYILSSTSVK